MCINLELKNIDSISEKHNTLLLVVLKLHSYLCLLLWCLHGSDYYGSYLKIVLGETASENATSHFHKRTKGQRVHNHLDSKPSLEQKNQH